MHWADGTQGLVVLPTALGMPLATRESQASCRGIQLVEEGLGAPLAHGDLSFAASAQAKGLALLDAVVHGEDESLGFEAISRALGLAEQA